MVELGLWSPSGHYALKPCPPALSNAWRPHLLLAAGGVHGLVHCPALLGDLRMLAQHLLLHPTCCLAIGPAPVGRSHKLN